MGDDIKLLGPPNWQTRHEGEIGTLSKSYDNTQKLRVSDFDFKIL